ncbi:MAG: hypothetical protein ACXABY_03775 [Candidatus Thorarchaeota archaeon]|jgi:hypothetical protein
MQIRVATGEEIHRALETTQALYNQNLRFYNYRWEKGVHSLVLKVKNAWGRGGYISKQACYRHTGHACWHAHRDFLRELFNMCPTAKVKTFLVYYKNREDFENKFQATGDVGDVGMWGRKPLRQRCNCNE